MIWNPWKAARLARAEARDARKIARDLFNDNIKLRVVLRQAHFRSPENGRLLPKGYIPEDQVSFIAVTDRATIAEVVEALSRAGYMLTSPDPKSGFMRARKLQIGFENPDDANSAMAAVSAVVKQRRGK